MSNNTMFEDEEQNVHVMIAVRRKKENPEITCKDEVCLREVCYQNQDKQVINLLKVRMQKWPGVWRIYKTVNQRSTEKARNIVMHWFIDGLYQKSKFNSVWTKALLQKECRIGKRGLVDIDTQDPLLVYEIMAKIEEQYLRQKNGKIYDEIKTPNGYHLVCDPFDKRILDEFDYAEVEYDRYYFVERLTIEKKL